jgi:hypothetical protein
VFLIQIMDRYLHSVATGCYAEVRQSVSVKVQANVWLLVWIRIFSGSEWCRGTSAHLGRSGLGLIAMRVSPSRVTEAVCRTIWGVRQWRSWNYRRVNVRHPTVHEVGLKLHTVMKVPLIFLTGVPNGASRRS